MSTSLAEKFRWSVAEEHPRHDRYVSIFFAVSIFVSTEAAARPDGAKS
jgi:hypothetical protein